MKKLMIAFLFIAFSFSPQIVAAESEHILALDEKTFFTSWTPPMSFPIKPYLGIELKADPQNEWKEGKSYKPEIGLGYTKRDSFSLSAGVGYREMDTDYAIREEVIGAKKGFLFLDAEFFEALEYSLNFTKIIGENTMFSFEPRRMSGTESSGLGVQALLEIRF